MRRTSARLSRRSSWPASGTSTRWLFARTRSGADKQIDLRLGTRIVAVDRDARTATTDDGIELRWDALVLATGARVRRLPFSAPDGVHVLRTASDALALRDELVPGHAARHRRRRLRRHRSGLDRQIELGVSVTMLVGGLAPFARALGPEIGRLLAHRYRRHGVDLRLGVAAAGFRTRPDGFTTVISRTDERWTATPRSSPSAAIRLGS